MSSILWKIYFASNYPTIVELEEIATFWKANIKASRLIIFPRNEIPEGEYKRFKRMWEDACKNYFQDADDIMVGPFGNNYRQKYEDVYFYGVPLGVISYLGRNSEVNLTIYLPFGKNYDQKHEIDKIIKFKTKYPNLIGKVSLYHGLEATRKKIISREKEFLNFLETSKSYASDSDLSKFVPFGNETSDIYRRFSLFYVTTKYLIILSYFKPNDALFSTQIELLKKETKNYKRFVFCIDSEDEIEANMSSYFKDEIKNGLEINYIYIPLFNTSHNYINIEIFKYMTLRGQILFTLFELGDCQKDSQGYILYPIRSKERIVNLLNLKDYPYLHIDVKIYNPVCQGTIKQ